MPSRERGTPRCAALCWYCSLQPSPHRAIFFGHNFDSPGAAGRRQLVEPVQQQPKKKMSPWAWVAIGCVGLIFVCAVVGGVGMWWVGHKVKNFAEEAQKNPELTAIKMIAAANPDIELVSTDDAAKKATLRNTKTGEEITLDFDDIKNGNFKWSANGQEASLAVDKDAGSIQFKGADGSTAHFGGGGKIPDWVPVYPGASANEVVGAENAEGISGTVSVESKDSLDQVFDFYKQQLQSNGYQVSENRFSSGDSQGAMLNGENDSTGRTLTISMDIEQGTTHAAISYQQKKQQ